MTPTLQSTIILAAAIGGGVSVIAAVLKAWISLRRTRVLEESETTRLKIALKDAVPSERPAIIVALKSAKPENATPGDTAEGVPVLELIKNLAGIQPQVKG
jgi:hypothetical protein